MSLILAQTRARSSWRCKWEELVRSKVSAGRERSSIHSSLCVRTASVNSQNQLIPAHKEGETPATDARRRRNTLYRAMRRNNRQRLRNSVHIWETRTDAWHHWATRSGGEAGDAGGDDEDGNCTLLLHGAMLCHVRVLVAAWHMPGARVRWRCLCAPSSSAGCGKTSCWDFNSKLDWVTWTTWMMLLSWILQMFGFGLRRWRSACIDSLVATLKWTASPWLLLLTFPNRVLLSRHAN